MSDDVSARGPNVWCTGLWCGRLKYSCTKTTVSVTNDYIAFDGTLNFELPTFCLECGSLVYVRPPVTNFLHNF